MKFINLLIVGFSMLANAETQPSSLNSVSFESVASSTFYDVQQSTGHSGYFGVYGKKVTISGSGVESGTFDNVVLKINFPPAYREMNVLTDSGISDFGWMLMAQSPSSCHLIAKKKLQYGLPGEFLMRSFETYQVTSATWNAAKTIYTIVLEHNSGKPGYPIECFGPAN